MTEIEIKAELYDLQYHTCNGVLTITNGQPNWERSNSCYSCNRILKLKNMLLNTQLTGVNNEEKN